MSAPSLGVTAALSSTTASDRTLVSLPALVAIALTALGVLSPELLGDADTLWHVAAGRWILAHHAIPHVDPFSYSLLGAPWTAHEWLAELLFAPLVQSGGWFALQALAAVCFGITGAIMLRFALARLEPMRALLLTMVAVGLCASHLLARPHVLTWPLAALWSATLFSAAEAERAPPWWLLLVLLLWANLHGSAPLGGIIAGSAALEALWLAPAAARPRVLWRWGRFLAGAVVALVLTPSGLHSLAFAADLSRMKGVLVLVNEWQSANFHEWQLFELWLLLMLALLASGRVRLSPPRVLLLVVLVHFALVSQRHHATLGLVFLFLVATPLARAWPPVEAGATPETRDARWWRMRARVQSRVGQLLTVTVVSILVVAASRRAVASPPPSVAPVSALAYARAHGLTGNGQGRVFNAYNFGGYLIEQGIPVYIDGRGDMYGTTFMQEMASAMTVDRPGVLESLLERQRVTWTLLPPRTPAAQYLDHLAGWTRVYADSFAVIHARTTPNAP